MPRASVWLIRAALLHLVAGALVGSAYLGWKAGAAFAFVAAWRPLHVELMLVGWMVQLVIGVAYWILPRREGAREGSPVTIWIVLVLINGGVAAAALGAVTEAGAWLRPGGRIAEALGAALFASHAWWRQRPYRGRARRALL